MTNDELNYFLAGGLGLQKTGLPKPHGARIFECSQSRFFMAPTLLLNVIFTAS